MRTRIDLYSGFLGAGKTTLIRKMLREAYAGERIALIENEFGQVAVDGAFLRGRQIAISEINAGCICCTLSDDFVRSLSDLADRLRPDRILIEPSGVGKLSDILAAVRMVSDVRSDLYLGSVMTVVDPLRAETNLGAFGYGEYFEDQIRMAKTIVFSRTGTVPEEKLEAALRLIRPLNRAADLVTTPWDLLDGKRLLTLSEAGKELEDGMYAELFPEHKAHDQSTHDLFGSWGAQTPRRYTEAELRAILTELGGGSYGAVLRAKGLVASGGKEFLYFDYVPGEISVRAGEPDATGRICVIGAMLNKRGIAELFGTGE